MKNTAHFRVFRPEDLALAAEARKPVYTTATLPPRQAYLLAHPKSLERITFFSAMEQFRTLRDSPDPVALQFRSDFYNLGKRILGPQQFDIFRWRYLQRAHFSLIARRLDTTSSAIARESENIEQWVGAAVLKEGLLANLRDALSAPEDLPRTA